LQADARPDAAQTNGKRSVDLRAWLEMN